MLYTKVCITLTSFQSLMFIHVCLTCKITHNGHYNKANLLGFITSSLGMCGKASVTPNHSMATGQHTSV